MTWASDSRWRRKLLKKKLVKEGFSLEMIRAIDDVPAFVEEQTDGSVLVGLRTKKGEKMMAQTTVRDAAIHTVLIVTDEALLRRNQTERKLGERGIGVVRSYRAETQPTAAMLEGVACCIMQAAHATPAVRTRWKTVADQEGVRFFFLEHQTSSPIWRVLEEWVAETVAGPSARGRTALTAVPEKPRLAAPALEGPMLKQLEELQKALRKETEKRESLEGEAGRLRGEVAALKKAGEQWATETFGLIQEREDLRTELSRTEAALKKTKAELDLLHKNVAHQRDAHALTLAARDTEIERLKKASVTASAASSSVATLPDVLPDLILKYDSLVQEGLMDGATALGRLVKTAKERKR